MSSSLHAQSDRKEDSARHSGAAHNLTRSKTEEKINHPVGRKISSRLSRAALYYLHRQLHGNQMPCPRNVRSVEPHPICLEGGGAGDGRLGVQLRSVCPCNKVEAAQQSTAQHGNSKPRPQQQQPLGVPLRASDVAESQGHRCSAAPGLPIRFETHLVLVEGSAEAAVDGSEQLLVCLAPVLDDRNVDGRRARHNVHARRRLNPSLFGGSLRTANESRAV